MRTTCRWRSLVAVILVAPLILSCATIAEMSRLSKYDEAFDAYQTALRRSQFRVAEKFVEPSVRDPNTDFGRLENVKIVDFRKTHAEASDDRREVRQAVMLQYFLLDQNIVKTVKFQEIWRFDQTSEHWWLYTNLPPLD